MLFILRNLKVKNKKGKKRKEIVSLLARNQKNKK